jgi:ribosome silencing factor RsfS/YbeB/iojap
MAEKRAKSSRPAKAASGKSAPRRPAKKTAKSSAKSSTGAAANKASKKAANTVSAIARKPKPAAGVIGVIEHALDDIKAVNVRVLDVRKLTDIADTLVIASGNSDRHVRSIADRVVEFAKKAGYRPMGVEGERDGEWVLVDLQDVIVHIMLPRVREFYRLESLWDVSAARREAAVAGE